MATTMTTDTRKKPAGISSGPGGKTAPSVLSTSSIPQPANAVDSQLIAAFLSHLHRGGAWAYWWTWPGKRSTWWSAGEPAAIPGEDVNVYFGVHPAFARKSTHERATLDDIAAVNCLFAEFDAKDFDGGKPAVLAHVDALSPAPSVIVDSGGGYHCYWLFAAPFVLDSDAAYVRARSVQRDWVVFVGGDPGAKDLARVLRVPGTRNLKYDHQPLVTIVRADLACLYDLDTLEALLPVQAATSPHRNNGGNGKSPWAEAALADELAILARTHEGQRNEQLNCSAFAMGQVVGGGHLDRARVERALSATALGIGLEEREVLATIRSGIEAGIRQPRGPKKQEQTTTPSDELQALLDRAVGAEGQERNDALRDLFRHLVTLDEFALVDCRERIIKALGISVSQFNRYLRAAQAQATGERRSGHDDDRYVVKDGRLCTVGFNRSGERYIRPLCNFTAEIVEDVAHDDGEDITRQFTVAGRTEDGRPLPVVRVDAARFTGMSWVGDLWGVQAVVRAGQSTRDQLREAIQLRSTQAERRHVYTHTGWREIGGRRVFLHAGGAVGAEGVSVELDREVERFCLPGQPEDLPEAVRASLRFLCVAPATITVPLWAAIHLAPLAEIVYPDFVTWLYGATGTLKSTVAALALCHYGHFTGRNLPAAWTDTANRMEMICFRAKDVPLVIDDFAPQSDPYRAREMEQAAARIVRNVGNRSGRGRLFSDLSLRTVYRPRGLVISTGEQVPDGQSITARMYTVELHPGDVNLERLSAAQGEDGRYTHAMTGYLLWLANQWDHLAETLPQVQRAHRAQLLREMNGRHLRVPDVLATLYLGLDIGLAHAVETGALSEAEAQVWRARGWEALKAGAEAQARRIERERPTHLFLETLGMLLDQNQIRLAKIRDKSGSTQPDAVPSCIGGGEDVGWYDEEYVHLLPAAYNRVARFVRDEGAHFPLKRDALCKSLTEEGYLVRAEEDRYTARYWDGERHHRVFRLIRAQVEEHIEALSEETDETITGAQTRVPF